MPDANFELLRFVLADDVQMGVTTSASSQFEEFSVQAADGQTVAKVYGIIVRGWLPATVSITGTVIYWQGSADDIAGFERDLASGLKGAFVAITQLPLPRRIYLDAGGQIPIVYDAAARRAGTSADALLNDLDYAARLLPDRIERLIGREGNGWIAGTLTAHSGIARLLPNHFLDLHDFTAHRFWPAKDYHHYLSFDDAVDRVARDLQGFVSAIAEQRDIAITLTAGFDSRLLLCASVEVKDRVCFVTMTETRRGIDQIVAQRLASQLGLEHKLITILHASEEQTALWDRHVGHAVREDNRKTHPTLLLIPAKAMLTGTMGETGRCRLYRQDVDIIDCEPATARFVLSRLTLPLESDLIEDIDVWLEPIRLLPRSVVLDLAYNELKAGSWAMGQAPIQKGLRMSLSPYAQRSVLDAFMGLAPHERGTSKLFAAVGKRLWPEAMQHPVNRFGDWRDLLAPLIKLTHPERVRRYLRDRFARS